MHEDRNPLIELKWLAHYFHKHGQFDKARDIYDKIKLPPNGGQQEQLQAIELPPEKENDR